jgi:folate-dependent phosphoribosylglycinamide formyltransferase PurN
MGTVPGQPLRVAVLTSVRAPGLAQLLADPRRRRLFEVVAGVVTAADSTVPEHLASAGVPVFRHELAQFCRARGARRDDLTVRRLFDAQTARLLASYRPDLLVLCGYLHVVTAPLLAHFPGRVVNLHDADLLLTGPDGRPRYRGLRSTLDALAAGEPETRSSLHLVTEEVDEGPVLLRSWGFPSHPLVADARRLNAERVLKAYAFAQREWMMLTCWGPLLLGAVERFARGEVRVLGGRVAVGDELGHEELLPEALVPRKAAGF